MSNKHVGIFVNDIVVIGRPHQSLGQPIFERGYVTQKLARDYLGELAMLMGGIAAEQIVFGAYSDGGGGVEDSDLTIATDLATRIECVWALGSTFVSELATDTNQI